MLDDGAHLAALLPLEVRAGRRIAATGVPLAPLIDAHRRKTTLVVRVPKRKPLAPGAAQSVVDVERLQLARLPGFTVAPN